MTTAVRGGAARERGVAGDALITVASRLVLAGLILATDVAVARLLGAEGKGAFALVLLFSQLAALLLGLGLDKALGVVAGRSAETARHAFANALLWTLLIGGLGVVLSLWLYAGGGSALLPDLPPAPSVLAALALPGEMFFAIGLVGLLGRRRVAAYGAIRVLRRAVLLILLVGVAAAAGLDLQAALAINVISLVAAGAAILFVAAKEGALGVRPDRGLLTEQLRFGARSMPGTLAERLQFRADAFLVNLLVGLTATGVYSVAASLAETLWYVPNALGIVMFSRAVQRDPAEAGRIASRLTRATLALTVLLALPVALTAPLLVRLVYGPEFAGAAFALQALLPGVVAYSVVAILSQYVVGRGAPGWYTLVLVAGLATNIAANVVLIPALGIDGAAVASSLSYGVTALLTLAIFVRLSGQGVRETLVVGRADVADAVATLGPLRRSARRSLGRGDDPTFALGDDARSGR